MRKIFLILLAVAYQKLVTIAYAEETQETPIPIEEQLAKDPDILVRDPEYAARNQGDVQGEPEIGSLRWLDFRYGFRDIRFETPLSSKMYLTESGEIGKFYRKSNENLNFGAALLEKITYGYHDNKLFIIIIDMKGNLNAEHALNVLVEAYGPPEQENPYIEKYYWNGDKVLLVYEKNPALDRAKITLGSKLITNEVKNEHETKNNNAARGL